MLDYCTFADGDIRTSGQWSPSLVLLCLPRFSASPFQPAYIIDAWSIFFNSLFCMVHIHTKLETVLLQIGSFIHWRSRPRVQ
jgi:hypothetical protein